MQRPRRPTLFFVVGVIGAMLLAFAALASSSSLAAFFQHPQREPGAAMYVDGANLLRVMCAVLAVSLLAWAFVLSRTLRPVDLPPKHTMSRIELVTVGVLVLIGAALRLNRMGESLWYDEVAAWQFFGQHGPGPIVGNFPDPANHIFHTLVSWLGVVMTENALSSEFALRTAAFIASLVSIAVMYAWGRRVAGHFTGMLTCAMFAIWPVCVLEGAEARGYSMMMLSSGLATLLLVVALDRKRAILWGIYAIVVALGVWTHMVTVFVAVGHGAFLVWQLCKRESQRDAFAGMTSLVLAAVITLTLYAPVLCEIVAQRGIMASTDGNQPEPFGVEGAHALMQLGGSWLWYCALPGLALLVIGVGVIISTRDSTSRNAAIAAIAGLPLAYLLVMAMGTWVYARFLLFALPGTALVAAIGWQWLWQRNRWIGIACAAIIATASGVDLVTRPPKQPLREAADYVYDHGGRNTRVLVISIAHSVLDAYSAGLNVTTSFKLGETIEQDLARTQPEWVIVLYPRKVGSATHDALQAHGFTHRAHFDGWVDWGHGDVDVYARGNVRARPLNAR